jgi:lipopolysaccharide transport system permease protein
MLYFLVTSEIKNENMDKLLGFIWSFLNPLLLMGVYVLVVVVIFGRGEPNFPILLFAGIISWRWFVHSLNRSVSSVTSQSQIVKTTRFPLAILPITEVLVGGWAWFFGFLVLIPMLFAFEANLTIHVLWLPLLVLVQLVGTIGAALFVAALGTYVSDLANVLQFTLRLGFYMSPIMYSVGTRIPEHYQRLYYWLNPFAGLMESYKNILVRGEPPSQWVLVAAVVAVVVFFLGFWYFNREERKLAKAI